MYLINEIPGYSSNKHIYSHVNIYEEMMQNRELACMKLFQNLNISTDFVPKALTAFQNHSQRNVSGYAGSSNREELISSQEWTRVDQLFELFELPLTLNMDIEQFSLIIH